ncbi:MAG: DUF433 domain-containing protein [Anaerolineae bacterium]|nr:DUF433 domain-containing protein [Anaerolineae bacterium]
MADFHLTERIVVSRDVLHGKPRIVGTRIAVYQILDLIGAGKTPVEITSDDYFPEITIDDVLACAVYASRVLRNEDVIPIV